MQKYKIKLKQFLKFILPLKLRLKLRNIYDDINANIKRHQAINFIPTLIPLESLNVPRYIVSLTSYGKRLTVTAPFAIATLLNQTVKPDKIILWVAHEDKKNIPHIMEKLIEKGLEIRFCEDIRSYTKLIPAIENFPNDYIITADDDLFYPQNWFCQLMSGHKSNQRKIICHRAHGIKVDENHDPISYMDWDFCIEPNGYFKHIFPAQDKSVSCHQRESIFPTGVGGILYPPKCLHKDTTDKELFMKFAPRADDIWFWAMAVIHKDYFGDESPYIVIGNGYSQKLLLVDPREERCGNTLLRSNWSENGNDKQLKAVIEQYPQIRDILRKICTHKSCNEL